jgi:ABC-2 type transport system ATP-binding protein
VLFKNYDDNDDNKKVLLKCRQLTKKFRGVTAIKNCNFGLAKGQIIGILGPEGSGKTTLVKMICGLMQPSDGEVRIRGRKPSYKINSYISYLPEQPFVNYQSTVEDLLYLYDTFFEDFRYNKAVKLLKHFEIDCFVRMDLLTLTEIQVVETIMVICRKADVYIFDDPLLNVEKEYRKSVLQMIETCKKEGVVLITSELATGMDSMLDRIMFITSGIIKLSCTKDEFIRTYEESISSVYKKIFPSDNA